MKKVIGFSRPNRFVVKQKGTYRLSFDAGPLLIDGEIACSSAQEFLTLNFYDGQVVELPNAMQAMIVLDMNGQVVFKIDNQKVE